MNFFFTEQVVAASMLSESGEADEARLKTSCEIQ